MKKNHLREFKINTIYRGFDDLEINKITHDAVVSYDRNRALTVKNITNDPLAVVTRYNNQTKVYEILAYPCEGHRMQTDIFPKPQLCHTNASLKFL